MNFSVTRIVMAALVAGGSVCVVLSAYVGGFIVVLAVVGTSLVALAVLYHAELKIKDDADALAKGNSYANMQAFLRELKEMDLRHQQVLGGLSQDLGAVSFEKTQLAEKFHRMTDRPRIRGRMVKKSDVVQIEGAKPQEKLPWQN